MEHRFLHTFRLTVEGIGEPIEFRMFLDLEDTAEAIGTLIFGDRGAEGLGWAQTA